VRIAEEVVAQDAAIDGDDLDGAAGRGAIFTHAAS
jgi:hypothetical protein